MRSSVNRGFFAAIVGAFVLSGCNGGSASVTDGLAGTVLQLHTVFGFITNMEVNGSGQMVAATPAPLTLVASGASFDPTSDLRFVSASTLLQVDLDQQKFGSLFITFPDMSKVTTGTTIDLTTDSTGTAGGFFSLNWGIEQLTNTSTEITPVVLGSTQTANFIFTQVPAKVGDAWAGTLTVTFTAATGDPMNAETGSLSVKLSGTIVNEVLGACNAEATNITFNSSGCTEPAGSGTPLDVDAGS